MKKASRLSEDYPWEDATNANGWAEEADLLLEAYAVTNNDTAKQIIAQFIDKRQERRKKMQGFQ